MMALHRAGIVVQQRERIACLDQEVVVHASVLVVMDDGREVTSQQLGQEQVSALMDDVITEGLGCSHG